VADTKRLLLQKAICAYLLSEITTANGYDFDLQAAYRNKRRFGKEMKLPSVALLENFNPDREPETIGGMNETKQQYEQIYLVNGWADDSEEDSLEHGDAAQNLLGDVKKALGKLLTRDAERDGYFGKLAIELRIEPGVVRPPDEQSSKAYFWMRIKMKIVEKVGDPYWISD
jgi:hypothetical protein